MEVVVAPGTEVGVDIRSLLWCWGISVSNLKDSGMGLASGKEAGAMGWGVGNYRAEERGTSKGQEPRGSQPQPGS